MVAKKGLKKLLPQGTKTLKSLIPKTKPLIPKARPLKQILDIRRKKTEFHKLFIASQKILFKQPKFRKKRVKKTKTKLVRSGLLPTKIGDSRKPVRVRRILPSIPTGKAVYSPPITSVSQICWVKLSPTGKKELKSAENFDLRFYRAMMADIARVMIDLRLALTTKAAQIIGRHVPRDTGDLQESLLESMIGNSLVTPPINPRNKKQIELRIGLFSTIPYLKYVNEPDRIITVRHRRSQRIVSYRGGRHYLHDPYAKTKFMFTVKAALRMEARKLTRDMLRSLRQKWKPAYTYNQVKGFFKYTGMGRI